MRLSPLRTEDFEQIKKIMNDSFPDTETRVPQDQEALLSDPHYHILVHHCAGQVGGFLAVWEFEPFRFVEHFAVTPSQRGAGTGRAMLQAYLAQSDKPVYLEVEPPETELAARRIGFYERCGFHLNPFSYEQPPLRKENPWIPLLLMSYPQPMTERDFLQYKAAVYRHVYGISE